MAEDQTKGNTASDGQPARSPALRDQTLTAELVSGPTAGDKLDAFGRRIKKIFGIDKSAEPVITVSGLIPVGAQVKAYPVNVEVPGQQVLVAYDITIYAPETADKDAKMVEWQPDDSLKVNISDDVISSEKGSVSIFHMENREAEPEYVQSTTVAQGAVEFEAESFSVYIVTDPVINPCVNYIFSYGSGENKTSFTVPVEEGELLHEPATPEDPSQGKFEGWFWDKDCTDKVDFTDDSEDSRLRASQAPRSVNIYGKFDGKHHITFMSLPMEDGQRRTFQTVVLDKEVDSYDLSQVHEYGAPAGYKFRGWTTQPVNRSDPYNNQLSYDANDKEHTYYTLKDTLENISGSMTLYPVIKKGYWVTFDADPTDVGGLVDGKGTKRIMAANDETWGEIYGEISSVTCPGYTLDYWYEGDTDTADARYTFTDDDPKKDSLVTPTGDKTSFRFNAKWTSGDVDVTFLYWKEDVTPELYTLMKTETRKMTAGSRPNLSDYLAESNEKLAGEFLSDDSDMKYFYLAEITSGDGTTDQDKLTPGTSSYDSSHTATTTVKGDGSTVINVWYDRKIVKLTFQDCCTTFVRLGEPLDTVWPIKDKNNQSVMGFVLRDNPMLRALYPYPTASDAVLQGCTEVTSNNTIVADSGYDADKLIQPASYYTDTKPVYQAQKTLTKLAGTMSYTANHWYEDTSASDSANNIVYKNTSDTSFRTAATGIVTREVEGYRIDYNQTYAQRGSRHTVEKYTSYEDGQAKQLSLQLNRNQTEYRVYYKANKYAINLFDGENLIERNDGIKFKTPLDASWVKIGEYTLSDLLAMETVDGEKVPTAEAEAAARALYGNKQPPDYMQFMGWHIDRDFAETDATYDATGNTMPSADINLYANWRPRKISVTVDKGTLSGQKQQPNKVGLDSSDVRAGTQILEYLTHEETIEGQPQTISFTAHDNTLGDYVPETWMHPTWRNHVFLGWEYRTYDEKKDSWSDWKAVSNWNDLVDVNTELRGNWQDMTPFNIHYFVDGHELHLDTESYLDGGQVIVKGYDKTNAAGEVFRHWVIRGEEGGEEYIPGDTLTIHGGDIYLTGVFAEGSVNPGEDPSIYAFMIWVPDGDHLKSGADTSPYKDWIDDEERTNRSAAYPATFTPVDYYADTATRGQGEWKVFYQEIIYSNDILSTPPHIPQSLLAGEDEPFQGWYTDPGLSRRFSSFGKTETPRNTILYASFKKPVTVTYHTIKGDVLGLQNYAWNGSGTLDTGQIGSGYIEVAKEEGRNKTYKLLMWTDYDYTAETGRHLYSKEQVEAMAQAAGKEAKFYDFARTYPDTYVNTDLHLYPVMVEGYTLYFDTDGGSYIAPEVYRFDEPTEAPVPPTKGDKHPEYTFEGWYKTPDDHSDQNRFVWGETLTQDTTVHARFVSDEDYRDVSAAVWVENEDGQTWSYAGSTVVTGNLDDHSDRKLVNTVFTLDDQERESLEASTAGASGPLHIVLRDKVGSDWKTWYEYTQVEPSDSTPGTNTSVMITHNENTLNLYYRRKRFDMTFNAVSDSGSGSFKEEGSPASYTISDVWLDKDIADEWPDASRINDPQDKVFEYWKGSGSDCIDKHKLETKASEVLLAHGGITELNTSASYTAQYQSSQISGDSVTLPLGTTPSASDLKYKVIIRRYVGDKLVTEVLDNLSYSQYLPYQNLFVANTFNEPDSSNTKISETSYNTPDMEAIKNASYKDYGDYELDADSMRADENSNSSSDIKKYQYSYKYIYKGGTTGGTCYASNAPVCTDSKYHWYENKPLYFWGRGREISVFGLGTHQYNNSELLYISNENGYNWTDSQGLILTDNSGNIKTGTIYYNIDARYEWDGTIYHEQQSKHRTISFDTFTSFTTSLPANGADGSRSNTYLTEYRRRAMEYTPGTVVLTYHYKDKADPSPATANLIANYGGSSQTIDQGVVCGTKINLSDLPTPDAADHTADIQAVLGSDYDSSKEYAFTGWYLDEERTTPFPHTGMTMPAEDLTVYAGWRNKADALATVTVTALVTDKDTHAQTRTTFTRDKGAQFGTFNIPDSLAYPEMELEDVEHSDRLLGWYNAEDPYHTIYHPTEQINQDITVKPYILKAGSTFTIKYSLNGVSVNGDPASEANNPINGTRWSSDDQMFVTVPRFYPGATVNVADVDSGKLHMADKPGYKQFFRWNTKADGTGDFYYPNETVDIPSDSDLVLYAEYVPYLKAVLRYDFDRDDFTNAPDYQDVHFKDYLDQNRGPHEPYVNSKWYAGMKYKAGNPEPDPCYEKVTFNVGGTQKNVELVRPGYIFTGWKVDHEGYDDHETLLRTGDQIRVTPPDKFDQESGDPVPNRLVASWKEQKLPVEVYECSNGKWKEVTDSNKKAEGDYKDSGPAAGNTIALSGTDGDAFARSVTGYTAPASGHYTYALAAVNGTPVTGLVYREKSDQTGYAWTYQSGTETVEMGENDVLRLFYSPDTSSLKVHYRIVEDGNYMITDSHNVVVDSLFTQRPNPYDADDKSTTVESVDTMTPARLDDLAYNVSGTTDYKLLGVFYGERFDKDKELSGTDRNLYYADGQFRKGSTGGQAIDGDVYVVYYSTKNLMVEARYASVEPDETTYSLLQGKTYFDVPKDGTERTVVQPDYPDANTYNKYGVGYGTVNGETPQIAHKGVTKMSMSGDHFIVKGDGFADYTMAADDVLFYIYWENPRPVKAYAFVYDMSGEPIFEKSQQLDVGNETTVASLGSQLGLDAEYTLIETEYMADAGAAWPLVSHDDVKENHIKNTVQGVKIALSGVYQQFNDNGEEHALYYLYARTRRTIPVRYMVRQEDGSYAIPEGSSSWWPADSSFTLEINGQKNLTGRAMTDPELPAAEIPDLTSHGYTLSEKIYRGDKNSGSTAASLSEIPDSDQAIARYTGEGAFANTQRLRAGDAVYYVYYPTERTALVHYVVKNADGSLSPIDSDHPAYNMTVNAAPANPADLTEQGIMALTGTVTVPEGCSCQGVFTGSGSAVSYDYISENNVTGKKLANMTEGLTITDENDGSEELLGSRDIYVVYCPQTTVHAHALILQPNGKLIQRDSLLADSSRIVTVSSSERTECGSAVALAEDAAGKYTYLGVTYAPSTVHLAVEDPWLEKLELQNTLDGIRLWQGSDSEAAGYLGSQEDVFYVFYPDPRPVSVYWVSKEEDGSLKVISSSDDPDHIGLPSSSLYTVSAEATAVSGSNKLAVPESKTDAAGNAYAFSHIAFGPEIEKDYDQDDEGNPVENVMTHYEDLNQISDEAVYFKNSRNGASYAVQKEEENLVNPQAMTAAKPAVYLVYNESVDLKITKSVAGGMGDKSKNFTFSLSVEDAVTGAAYRYTKGTDTTELSLTDSTGSFTLKDGEYVTVKVPRNKVITITESGAKYYTTTTRDDTVVNEGDSSAFIQLVPAASGSTDSDIRTITCKIKSDAASAAMTIVNTHADIAPTGVTARNLPYIIILLAGFTGAALLMLLRRRRND